ncbi:hypothetical protein GLOIN_2v1885941 [Rhizophagus irregularis DAOM 181602=DAOM 197198]|nr:hypothetical protein GLOIN_2v1885941 [Rhizophagus irregularis DAOM 181602=DAOM 197198]
MESGNKLRESSQAKAEAETTAVKPTLTPAKPSMTKLTFFRLRDGFLQIQKLKIENKIDTLSKEIHEFKSELKNLLSDKINLSSSAKESFIVDVVKNVSKLLIKVSIYPTKDKCYGAVEGYLVLNHASFFSNFTEDDWITYYNENIHKQLTKQVQSIRGTLSSKSKEAIFSIFGSCLPPINTNAEPSEVAKWKRKPEVKDCFEGLTCICSCDLLNNFKPKSCRNNVEKEYHETKVKKFLKKINSQTGINYSDFKDNSYEEEESGNETEDEDDDV